MGRRLRTKPRRTTESTMGCICRREQRSPPDFRFDLALVEALEACLLYAHKRLTESRNGKVGGGDLPPVSHQRRYPKPKSGPS